jgi:uncharacterized membrane protein YkoI
MTLGRLACAAAMLGVFTAGAAAAEKKVQMKDLPAAVRQAVQENLRGATIKGLSKEVENGATHYEAETMLNGRARDLLFDARGTLVEVEEELAADAVPAPVKAAAEARGKVVMIESVTRGTTVTYEAHVQKNGKEIEVALDANGRTPKR